MNSEICAAVIGLSMLGVIGTAQATLTTIPMDLNSWTYTDGQGGANGSWEQTSEGIKFDGSGYRQGGCIVSNTIAEYSNSIVYVKWMANGGADYMFAGPFVGTTISGWCAGTGGPYLTTDHSFGGSVILPENTWLYTQIDFKPDMTSRNITATGNYAGLGGSVLAVRDTETWMTADIWHNYVENGHVLVQLGDNYAGTNSWVLVSEAKYQINSFSVPEPGTFLLMVIGLFSLANAVRRNSGTPRIAPNK